MSTVTPPPQMPPPTLPSTSAQVTVTVTDPPPALSSLAKGAALEAIITTATSKGQVQVDSPVGKFAMRTTLPLSEGTKLALQVAKVGQQVQLRITALNGTAINLTPSLQAKTPILKTLPDLGQHLGKTVQPAKITPQHGQKAAPKQATASANLRNTLATLKRTHGIQAQVVRGATPVKAPAPGQAAPVQPSGATRLPTRLPTGTQLTVRINTIQAPHQTAAAQTAKLTPHAAPPQTGRAAAPVQAQPVQAAQAPTAPQTAGQPIAGTIQAGGTPSGQAPLMTLQGTVASNTHGTQPIVNTPQGMIALSIKGELPPGTQISLDIMTQTPPPATRTTALPVPPLSGNTGWPNLDQALQTLQEVNPKLAQQLQQAIPQANPRLAAALIAFTGAMRPGESRNWPGEGVIKGLEKANSKLAKSLTDDLSELSNRTTESTRGEWKAISLPFSYGAEIEKIMLYVHRDPEEQDEEQRRKDEESTRFLIDLDLSRLGPMQLDGYVVSKDRRFDLIIRTNEPLEPQVRRNILGMYNNSLDALGIKGTVSFLITRTFVRPSIPLPEEGAGPGLVV